LPFRTRATDAALGENWQHLNSPGVHYAFEQWHGKQISRSRNGRRQFEATPSPTENGLHLNGFNLVSCALLDW
jgi:hypothetical protein